MKNHRLNYRYYDWYSLTKRTLLHLIIISPNEPFVWPLIISSASLNCKFIYLSKETNIPLYSIPHFSLTKTHFAINSCKNGIGFSMTPCYINIS